MSSPAVVLSGIEGIIVERKILDCTLQTMVEARWCPPSQPANPDRKLDIIAEAIKNRPVEQVDKLTNVTAKQVGASCLLGVTSYLSDYHDYYQGNPDGIVMAGYASAPDFVIEKSLGAAKGLFTTIVSSTFEVDNGCYTGSYKKLDKATDAKSLLNKYDADTFELLLVNGSSDAPLLGMAQNIIAVNPGPSFTNRYLDDSMQHIRCGAGQFKFM